MKKTLLALSLILCFGVVNAQQFERKALKQTTNRTENGLQKTIVNPNHVPTTFKVVKSSTDPIPDGYARVSLTAGDVWGDGSGYQMLLDSTHSLYGTVIPAQGPLTASGNVPDSIYAKFAYKIPTNADGALTTTNIVVNNSVSIDIPAGTYDFCITNPTAGSKMWIASGTYGRYDDFVFAAGQTYAFSVVINETTGNDNATLMAPYDASIAYNETQTSYGYPTMGTLTNAETISTVVKNVGQKELTNITVHCIFNNAELPTQSIATLASGASSTVNFTADMSAFGEYSFKAYLTCDQDNSHSNDSTDVAGTYSLPATSITWDFNNCTDYTFPSDWKLVKNDNGAFYTTDSPIFATNDAWEIVSVMQDTTDLSAASAAVMTDTNITADRWLISPVINLAGTNYLTFAFGAFGGYPTLDVLVSNGSDNTADFTSLKTCQGFSGYLLTQVIDLSAHTGNVRLAFHNNNLANAIATIVDNIKVRGGATTGLNNVNGNSEISIYPNPATSNFTINNARNANVKVVDMMGRVVLSQKVANNSEMISTSNLNQGVYVVEINNNGKVSNQKLVIK
jgi:hypothetical protein